MNIADATHIVYPTREARTVHVNIMLRNPRGWSTGWWGWLTMKQVTSIRDALDANVYCLPPGRLYVNGVCVCEFGCALTGESVTRKETTI